MPIEIRELVIKAVVRDRANNDTSTEVSDLDVAKLKEEIIADCVDEVLEILKTKSER